MTSAFPILVATEIVEDAALVKRLLDDEFDNVVVSTDPDRAVEDFEKYRPSVLVLSFNTLEKAERYYLGLYRLSSVVHALPHRTVILCNKDDLRRVFALCKKEYFDDYVLFWPMTHDAPRLPMTVHRAIRQVSATHSGEPSAGQFAAEARRTAVLQEALESSLAQGSEGFAVASQSLKQARIDIEAALDGFSQQIVDGQRPELVEIKDRAALQREFDRLKKEELAKHFGAVAAAVQPLSAWPQNIRKDLAQPLASMRTLQQMAERIRPLILAVDDDEFQQRLLESYFSDSPLELLLAASGIEALTTLRRRRPDLVLMDFALPDIDGVEAIRRLKSVEVFASIPVIMMTGHSGKEVVMESSKAGACDFVVKPFDKEVLLAKIRRFLA